MLYRTANRRSSFRAVYAVAALPLLIVASGCSSLRVSDTYVQADRTTFDVVEPVVRALADEDPPNDPDLTGVNGEAVLTMLDSWKLRLEAAEGE